MDTVLPDWSDLPEHLIYLVATRLNTRLDRLRFRAVCHSFLTSIPPPPKPISPNEDFIIYFPVGSSLGRRGEFALAESTIYGIEPLNKITNTHLTTKTWIVKVEESKFGRVLVEDPLSRLRLDNLTKKLPKSLNLLDYRVKEITKSYRLELVGITSGKPNNGELGSRQMVFFEKVVVSTVGGFGLMALISGGQVGVWTSESGTWANIDIGRGFYFEDIAYRGEKFYAMGNDGVTVSVDPATLHVFDVAGPVSKSSRGLKCLVESCNDLFLVDKYWVDKCHGIGCFMDSDEEECAVHLNVFKLDEEKQQWVEVKDELEDRVLFVGEDCCFSLLAKEFAGCKPNCVYFTDDDFYKAHRNYPGISAGIFEVEDDTAGSLSSFPGYSKIFWPPPPWLKRNSN